MNQWVQVRQQGCLCLCELHVQIMKQAVCPARRLGVSLVVASSGLVLGYVMNLFPNTPRNKSTLVNGFIEELFFKASPHKRVIRLILNPICPFGQSRGRSRLEVTRYWLSALQVQYCNLKQGYNFFFTANRRHVCPPPCLSSSEFTLNYAMFHTPVQKVAVMHLKVICQPKHFLPKHKKISTVENPLVCRSP